MKEHPSYWADHSYAQLKPSSMRSMPRLCFLSITKRRSSHSRTVSSQPPHSPQKPYEQAQQLAEPKKKKNNRRRRKSELSQIPEDTVQLINLVNTKYDHLLAPPYIVKREDP